MKEVIRLPTLALRSWQALHYARRRGIPGMEFDTYGRTLGFRLIRRGHLRGVVQLLLNPISIVRYFELPFVASFVPESLTNWLDISSPRLLVLRLAEMCNEATIHAINPDVVDINSTRRIAAALDVENLRTEAVDLATIHQRGRQYDCVSAVSVIEHIVGRYDDSRAIELMYEMVKPGGQLLLTFPVDRQFGEEFRESHYYGARVQAADGRYFFQRLYDSASIDERLLKPIGAPAHDKVFFGETRPGTYRSYEERWMRDGLTCTVADPQEIADCYDFFARWDDMPGLGVCGMRIQKPLT